MTIRRNVIINFFPVPLVTIPMWVTGIVIANGFWSTLFAVVMPLWAWYVAIEKLLMYFGVI
jgi:hypothetical protein